MSFGILDVLGPAAGIAASLATGGNPLVGAAVSAGLSGGKTALMGGNPEQIAMSAGMSGAGSAVGGVGEAAGGALGGAAGEAIGRQVAPMALNAGIGALQGKSPEQIAYEQAKSGMLAGAQYGISQFASGGPINPAVYATRAHFADGGSGDGGASQSGDGGWGGGGGGGDAPAPEGGYMGATDPGLSFDMGGGGGWGYSDGNGAGDGQGAGNGSGIIDTGGPYDFAPGPVVEAPPAATPWNDMPKPFTYVPSPNAPNGSTQQLLLPNARGWASNFAPTPPGAIRFAGGGRVGYAPGGEIYEDGGLQDYHMSPAVQDAFYPDASVVPAVTVYDQPAGPPTPDWWDRNSKWAAPVGLVGGITALGTLGNMLSGKKKTPTRKTSQQLQSEYPMIPYRGGPPVAAPGGYNPGISPEWNYFPTRGYAKGGGIEGIPGGEGARAMAQMNQDPEERSIHGRRVMDAAERALSSNHDDPQGAIGRFRAHFGDDALATLMAKARRGDGMSDSLPATIDGQREAALASGEFVIPADAVAHAGNGSNQAGAREMQLMVDRLRKSRTGTTKQAPKIKPDTYLPG